MVRGESDAELSLKLDLVYKLIKRSFEVMPMLPVTLCKQIRSEFPYFKAPSFIIVGYIHNLLKLIQYCPRMTHDILKVILENLVRIDVQVTREEIEQSEEDEEEAEAEDVCDKMRLPLAETLDNCMEKLLHYCHTNFSESETADKPEQKDALQAILQYFEEQILKTNTKHLQFVLFYIAGLRVSAENESLVSFTNRFLFRNPFTRSSSLFSGGRSPITTSR